MAEQNVSPELAALKERIANTPELSHLKSIFEENDEEKIAMLLDSPEMLDLLVQMKGIYGQYLSHEPMEQDDESEDENDPRFLLKKCTEINTQYFKANSATNVCTA